MLLLCNLLRSIWCCMISGGLSFRPVFPSLFAPPRWGRSDFHSVRDFILLVSSGFCSSGSPIWDFSRSSSPAWDYLTFGVSWHFSIARASSLPPGYTFLSVCGCPRFSSFLAACCFVGTERRCLLKLLFGAAFSNSAAEHWHFLSGTLSFSKSAFKFPDLNYFLILLWENDGWIKCNQALNITWSVQPSTKWVWGSHETVGSAQLKAVLFT